MKGKGPIYTESTKCQDCYKCVRHCSVKAIEVKDDRASVIDDLCIKCGICVNICPVGAKKVRDDLDHAKILLQRKEKVIVSLAPSFVSEYSDVDYKKLISAFLKLGFWGVSETALGAEAVSLNAAKMISESDKHILISSSCPAVVDFAEKYYPELTGFITPLISPVIAHGKLLRQYYGDDIGIVFISPCIAKKDEIIKRSNGSINVALTFVELNLWLESEGIDLSEIDLNDSIDFIPERASKASVYPLDGGMNESIKGYSVHQNVKFLSFSGLELVKSVFEGIKSDDNKSGKVFIELLSCDGGCINGPALTKSRSIVDKIMDIESFSQYRKVNLDYLSKTDTTQSYSTVSNISSNQFSDEEIRNVLKEIGKVSDKDELNCSGCGYDSCKSFGMALLSGRAESSMCVSHMRNLALNKAHALIQSMPAGIVIVDQDLKVIENNKKFVEIIGGEAFDIYDITGSLMNADLSRLIAFSNIYNEFFESGNSKIERNIRHNDNVLQVTIFPIEDRKVIGTIIQDITGPSVFREQIVEKTKKVIRKNLNTVQQIAYLLGENAAESEVILNSVIETFALPKKSDDNKDK